MKRRDFLKLTGLAGTLAVTGCGKEPTRYLIPFLNPPEDIVPGIPTWFATSCRQCPAGCGILAKNREARTIKFEGNPVHPINMGRLCARGQAGLQDLYSPDRLNSPLLHERGKTTWLSWSAALQRFLAESKTAGGKTVVISGLEDGYRADLLTDWLSRNASSPAQLISYEPVSYDALRDGNRIAFGLEQIPSYDFSQCDFILSLGADFLETWISPVEFARYFTLARDPRGKNARFVYAGPRLSMTAANADRWITLRPGHESTFAFALLAALVAERPHGTIAEKDREKILRLLSGLSAENLAKAAGIEPSLVARLATRIASSRLPIVLADNQVDTVVAANLINAITGSASSCMDFSRPLSLSRVSHLSDMHSWMERLAAGMIRMVVIHKSNPVYSLPGFADALAKVPFVVALDSSITETASAAHLVLPIHTSYESWETYSPKQGLINLIQPTMGPITDSRPVETILSPSGDGSDTKDTHLRFRSYLASKLGIPGGESPRMLSTLAKGVVTLPPHQRTTTLSLNLQGYRYQPPHASTGLTLLASPSLRWFDGRDANKTWMMEVPDPLTNITWDAWAEVHPDRARKEGIEEGDIAEIVTGKGKARAGVHIYRGIHPDAIAVQIGLGHSTFGRYAGSIGLNPLALTAGLPSASIIRLVRTGQRMKFAHTDGSQIQHGRNIAQVTYEPGLGKKDPIEEVPVRLPIETGYDPKTDMYPPHSHDTYRWGMVIDLDRCIGCSACMVACYAENNVSTVGKEQVIKRREMAWIRIERYFETEENPGVRFLPMLCQHCDQAPCEPVCPVYAPTHDKEGLNLQVYNRCIGTRFCMQNDPYKVRRFNFFHYRVDSPLHMQLNPDVTARTKGVMEKCSFCIQRIKSAHQTAKVENRKIRDQEVIPACVQTCPAHVFTFGSFLDPNSLISQKVKANPRAYQVLAELHTVPAIIYLKKIMRDDGLGRL